jgi:hypothetical protein
MSTFKEKLCAKIHEACEEPEHREWHVYMAGARAALRLAAEELKNSDDERSRHHVVRFVCMDELRTLASTIEGGT